MHYGKSFVVVVVLSAAVLGCGREKLPEKITIEVGAERAIRTPAEARDAVRDCRAKRGGALPTGGIEVVIDDGVYLLREPLALDANDSGDAVSPVVWRARNRGKVTFSGAREATAWRAVSDQRILSLIPEASRPHVRVADVPAGLEITDFHGGSEECYSKRLNYPLWLYQNGRRLDMARYPNRPPDPRELKPGYIFTGFLTKGKQGGEFKLREMGGKLSVWRNEPDLWVYGLFLHEYADMKMRVRAIDPALGTMALDNKWYPRGFAANRPFHVFNAFSEIDVPGEWAMDRASRKVYLWPSADLKSAPPVFGVTTYLVTGTNVANVVFDGIEFAYPRRDALRFDNCRNVRVQASTVVHTGAWGVTVEGGEGCRVEGCDLTDLGEGGVRLNGGEWKTLVPGRHVADNNHISHYGEVIPSYRAGVSLAGVGNRCTHNLIHHTRHQAVWFNGNDHEIGFNVIHDTCLYNDDAGAVYCCQRDFTKRGTVIEYNFIHATGKRPHPTNVHCIYLDDWSSGTIVRGNILNQATWGIHLGGGQDTVATNNLAIACEVWGYLGTRRWTQFFPHNRIDVDSQLYRMLSENAALWETPAWKGRYPRMLDPLAITNKVIAHDPINCRIVHNAYWMSGDGQTPRFDELKPYYRFADNLACTNNPGVADYSKMDFNYVPGSKLWKFFGGPSRFDEMGLYDSPLRASPPVKFGATVTKPELMRGLPKQVKQPAVIRIDVTVAKLPDGVREIAGEFENAFILASSKGKRIVGFSETDEAPYDCHWEACSFSFVPNFDGDAVLALSGRFGEMTEYRNVRVSGAKLEKKVEGAANHNLQKTSKLVMKKGVRVTVDFEARRQPDAE